MISIATYGTCQEMQVNGPQNTLLTLAVATSALVFIVEGITTQMMAEPTVARLTATTITRRAVTAFVVCVSYFM